MPIFQTSLDALHPYAREAEKIIQDCSCRFFFDAPETEWLHGVPRLVVYLAGSTVVDVYQNNGIDRITVSAPAVCYSSGNAYYHGRGLDMPVRSFSVSYYGTYIRTMHIDYDGIHQPPTERDAYFHTTRPLGEAGQLMLSLIERLHAEQHDELLSPLLLPLFQLTMAQVLSSDPSPVRKVRRLWEEISLYLRNHREENLSRQQIAAIFQLSPSYVSRLARTYMGESFSDIQLRYRLEHAASYLRNTRLSVGEISFRCGFQNTSYFIHRFHEQYGDTPHVWRNNPANYSEPPVRGQGEPASR